MMGFTDKIWKFTKKILNIEEEEIEEEGEEFEGIGERTLEADIPLSEYNKRVNEIIQQLRGELDKEKRKGKRREKELKKLREERRKEERMEAYEKKEKREAMEERKKERIWFHHKSDKYIVSAIDNREFFRDGEGIPYKKWVGLEFKTINDGTGFKFLVTTEDPEDDTVMAFPKGTYIPISYWHQMIEWEGFVPKADIGTVAVNIGKDGFWTKPKLKDDMKKAEEIKKRYKCTECGTEVVDTEKPDKCRNPECNSKDIEEVGSISNLFSVDMTTVLKNAPEPVRRTIKVLYNRMEEYMMKARKYAELYKRTAVRVKDKESAVEATQNALNEEISRNEKLRDENQKLYTLYQDKLSEAAQANLKASIYTDKFDQLAEEMKRLEAKSKVPQERVDEVIGRARELLEQGAEIGRGHSGSGSGETGGAGETGKGGSEGVPLPTSE